VRGKKDWEKGSGAGGEKGEISGASQAEQVPPPPVTFPLHDHNPQAVLPLYTYPCPLILENA
jgi:hypothetical protein